MLMLHGRANNGPKGTLYFDQHAFKFYFDPDKKHKLQTEHVEQSNDISVIVPLGYTCKSRCVYCTQRKLVKEVYDRYNFISEVEKCACSRNIAKIHFIGGEPLLQFKVIEDIVSMYPGIKYSIITNGYYIDKTISEFLIEKQFDVCISHDGAEQQLQRGTNIFDPTHKERQCVIDITDKLFTGISSVLCGDKVSTLQRYKFFNDLGLTFKYVDICPVIPYNSKLIRLMAGTHDWNRYMSILLMDIFSINSLNDEHCGNTEIINSMYKLLCSETVMHDKYSTHCPIFNNNIITINIAGQRQYCFNAQEAITPEETYLKRMLNKKCDSCPVVSLCTAGCRHVNKEIFDSYCKRSYHHKIAYFIYFVFKMFGFMISSIEGDSVYDSENIFKINTSII